MKRQSIYSRRMDRAREAAGALCAVVAAGLISLGCESNASSRVEDAPAGGEADRREEKSDVGPYVITRDVLFQVRNGRRDPVLALPGGGPATDTLELDRGSGSALGAPRFRRVIPAPDSMWVAWEVVGGGAWVGVLAPLEPRVRTLGHWTEGLPDTLLWSPAGRYLAVRLRGAEGTLALEVFDTEAGERLTLPWEAECAATRACDITEVRWVGGTLLDVDIRPGPDESSVPYEVNVEDLTPTIGSEEES